MISSSVTGTPERPMSIVKTDVQLCPDECRQREFHTSDTMTNRNIFMYPLVLQTSEKLLH